MDVMDPYEVEFKERPRALRKDGKKVRTGPPKMKEGAMVAVLSYLSGSWNRVFVPINVSRRMGLGIKDLMVCLEFLRDDGHITIEKADRSDTYCLLGKTIVWNGLNWVVKPDQRVSTSSLRRRSRKIDNRRSRKKKEKEAAAVIRRIRSATIVHWDETIFVVEDKAKIELHGLIRCLDGLSSQGSGPRPCRKCGVDGCKGGGRGRKFRRKRELRACMEREVASVLES